MFIYAIVVSNKKNLKNLKICIFIFSNQPNLSKKRSYPAYPDIIPPILPPKPQTQAISRPQSKSKTITDKRYCWVPGCCNYENKVLSDGRHVKLHSIPSEKGRKEILGMLQNIGVDMFINKDTLICGEHFKGEYVHEPPIPKTLPPKPQSQPDSHIQPKRKTITDMVSRFVMILPKGQGQLHSNYQSSPSENSSLSFRPQGETGGQATAMYVKAFPSKPQSQSKLGNILAGLDNTCTSVQGKDVPVMLQSENRSRTISGRIYQTEPKGQQHKRVHMKDITENMFTRVNIRGQEYVVRKADTLPRKFNCINENITIIECILTETILFYGVMVAL